MLTILILTIIICTIVIVNAIHRQNVITILLSEHTQEVAKPFTYTPGFEDLSLSEKKRKIAIERADNVGPLSVLVILLVGVVVLDFVLAKSLASLFN